MTPSPGELGLASAQHASFKSFNLHPVHARGTLSGSRGAIMRSRIVLLSGAVGSGKTTLTKELADRYGFRSVRTSELMHEASGASLDRERGAMQKRGEDLDTETDGKWVLDGLQHWIDKNGDDKPIVLDAVRIKRQIDHIREVFEHRVTHIHLTASADDLATRYKGRADTKVREFKTYAELQQSAVERNIEALAATADVVINTTHSSKRDVFVRASARLGLYGKERRTNVDVLIGGQYGSEGKGNVASFLAPEYQVLVRSGGPNAGHKVYEFEEPYTFHLLPSGTRRNPNALLVLAPGSVLSVATLLKEIRECNVDPDRLVIDPQAMIIEDSDKEAEQALVAEIGSTGQGVGVATSRKILRTSANPPVRLARDVDDLRQYVRATREVLDDAFAENKRVLVEGTQGTGLSLHHGSYPHVTSRDTTVAGTLSEIGIAPNRVRRIVMVCRTYPIRVESPHEKDSGPMAKEITLEEVARRSGVDLAEMTAKERTSTTNKKRRIAEFDWGLLRQSASLNGPTDVALTFADYLSVKNRDARRFDQLTDETIQFIEEVESVAAAPVSLITTRFHFRGVIDRRRW